jgi:hypothetical protein
MLTDIIKTADDLCDAQGKSNEDPAPTSPSEDGVAVGKFRARLARLGGVDPGDVFSRDAMNER